MTKACIIGVSGYGAVHYELLLAAQAAGQVEIVGAAIINQAEEPEKCARLRALGCCIFDDYHDMLRQLAGKADLCLIPTGIALHRPMTVAAVAAGMHVLVEKPAAGCVEDARAMQAAAEQTGKIVAVGYQHLYASSTMAAKQHILAGTIGKLESIKCLVMWPRDHSYYARNRWAGALVVDGVAVNDSPFNNAVAHELMMMLFLAGGAERAAATAVSVEADLYRANEIESADTAAMQIETAEGVPIRFYATHACQETLNPEIHVRGSKGTMIMTHERVELTSGDRAPEVLHADNGRKRMIDAVLDVTQGGNAFYCDLDMASRQTQVVSMIHAATSIQPVASETIELENGKSRTFIPGIEEVLRTAFDRGTMLSLKKTIGIALSMALITISKGAETLNTAVMPATVVDGFEQRVEAVFRAESGKPLVRAEKRPPLGPGRGNYVRGYSYSMVAFSARCLYLGEMLDEANAALAENAQHYLDNPRDINDRDSFHWHAEIVMRLIEMYGTDGSKQAGRITPGTEALALRPIFAYAQKYSTLEKADHATTHTWHIYESENHHVMSVTVCWHFAKLARDRPEYQEVEYNGATAAEHYAAWNNYFVVYCLERARKGMFIEMMNGPYNSTLIKGIYNFYDFGEPSIRHAAGMLLDLYFAYWAQEQIDGVQGGGRSRVYFFGAFHENRNAGMGPLAWFYFGMGRQPGLNGHDVNAALSGYRPPAVVTDLALDVAGRGRYEVRQYPRGLVTAQGMHPYRMNPETGGILRYSFCDPAFIMGTLMTEARPNSDWAKISSQNRWQGVIFAGEQESRIVPIVRPKDNRVAFNAFWSLQSKGSLITQKLKASNDGAEMMVWISEAGLQAPLEADGIVFVEAEGAYAAIRVVKGGFKWMEGAFDTNRYIPEHTTMILNDAYAPVILDVMAKRDVDSFDDFKARVKACTMKMDGPVLTYSTIYGDVLTFDTSYKQTPTINGSPVNDAPKMAFESPFLHSEYNSGIVTISKGEREKVLDFNVKGVNMAFEQADAGKWQVVFADPGTGDWKDKWFLDGEVGTVKTGPEGMTLTGGPEFRNDAHHIVLWTKESFEGDLKIEYDYTRLDEEERCVTILYIQATGSGKGPYAKDITEWNALRKVPAMAEYFNHMHAYHISYAAFPNVGRDRTSYIRGRRYLPEQHGLKGTDLEPDYYPKGLFATGVKHHITVIKQDRDLYMRIENPDQVYYCHMGNPDLPPITEGRIGLRHMFTRSARYQNLRISTP